MKRVVISILLSVVVTSCTNTPKMFKSRIFSANEGYLSIEKINQNVQKQLPIKDKIKKDEITIVNLSINGDKKFKKLVTSTKLILKSFQIPEGTTAIATLSSGITYDTKTQTFKMDNIQLDSVKFLNNELAEYISKSQKKFTETSLKKKISNIVLHKSKKQIKTVNNYVIEDDKIKIIFK